jgi:nucleoside-diphosphate-sugar epimerase
VIVAVTGGTGFVGKAAVDRLLEAGHAVRALARRPQEARDGITWVSGALGDQSALEALCDGAGAVLHIAGVVNAADAAGFEAANVGGTLAVISAADGANVKRFVHVSSLSAREPGLSMYGASKRKGEDAVVASARDWCVVRPPGVYGPGDTEMLDMFRLARRGLALLPPAGRVSLIHVDDLARLLAVLVDGGPERQILEPDDGTTAGWSHKDFADALGQAVGRRGVVKLALPKALLGLGARIDKAARGAGAKLTADRVAYLSHPDWVAAADEPIDPAIWTPAIETRAGLAATARWYRDAGWL